MIRSVGAEYEQILKEKLVRLGVCFVDENLLRKQGYDKTPDFKLEIPIGRLLYTFDFDRINLAVLLILVIGILFMKINKKLCFNFQAIAGQVVNWIESKALFGDEETHQTYLDDQLMSYWNRYCFILIFTRFSYKRCLLFN